MTPVEEYLFEQQRLQTPVARIAGARFSAGDRSSEYADLIPLSLPLPGEQYAFQVDLDSCTGCKACVAACHSLNGLDEHETWRDIGELAGADARGPFTQTVTTACHHCVDPACLNGCPVLAYEKDPVTGIVSHLDDQCIGCSYCILKCPYEVPKYNAGRGIVRKCDMCQGRLAHDEAPACAQACPTQAIRIVTVAVSEVKKVEGAEFLPAAPDPAYTQPTTRYVSRRGLPPDLIASDAEILRAEPAHWPLAIMLTLVSMGTGCVALAALAPAAGPSPVLVRMGWVAAAAGLAASVAHLGQPLRAWRIFLGLRRSWMSREAIVLGAWIVLEGIVIASGRGPAPPLFRSAFVPGLLAALGLAGLFCSVMIYADTRRSFWRLAQTGPRFFGSALVLGLGTAFLLEPLPVPGCALMGAMALKLAFECRMLRVLDAEDGRQFSDRKTALLLTGPLRPVFGLRILAGLIGGIFLPFFAVAHSPSRGVAIAALAIAFAGELVERHLFFRAVVAPRMPGTTRP